VQALDLSAFLSKISIWAIPVLFAISLHEVAHGWMARYFGDRTAEMLGRLSLNPLRHIDPIGTVLVPAFLLAIGGPLIGWAKPVPVATKALRNPRRAMVLVAFAGPLANLVMASLWCAVLGAVARINGNVTLIGWIALMAQAGIVINVVLAVFNLLPIPPLDGSHIFRHMLPYNALRIYDSLGMIGLILILFIGAPLVMFFVGPALALVNAVLLSL